MLFGGFDVSKTSKEDSAPTARGREMKAAHIKKWVGKNGSDTPYRKRHPLVWLGELNAVEDPEAFSLAQFLVSTCKELPIQWNTIRAIFPRGLSKEQELELLEGIVKNFDLRGHETYYVALGFLELGVLNDSFRSLLKKLSPSWAEELAENILNSYNEHALAALLEAHGDSLNPSLLLWRINLNNPRSLQIATALLKKGADPNALPEERSILSPPLYRVIKGGAYEIAEVFLSHGAKIPHPLWEGPIPPPRDYQTYVTLEKFGHTILPHVPTLRDLKSFLGEQLSAESLKTLIEGGKRVEERKFVSSLKKQILGLLLEGREEQEALWALLDGWRPKDKKGRIVLPDEVVSEWRQEEPKEGYQFFVKKVIEEKLKPAPDIFFQLYRRATGEQLLQLLKQMHPQDREEALDKFMLLTVSRRFGIRVDEFNGVEGYEEDVGFFLKGAVEDLGLKPKNWSSEAAFCFVGVGGDPATADKSGKTALESVFEGQLNFRFPEKIMLILGSIKDKTLLEEYGPTLYQKLIEVYFASGRAFQKIEDTAEGIYFATAFASLVLFDVSARFGEGKTLSSFLAEIEHTYGRDAHPTLRSLLGNPESALTLYSEDLWKVAGFAPSAIAYKLLTEKNISPPKSGLFHALVNSLATPFSEGGFEEKARFLKDIGIDPNERIPSGGGGTCLHLFMFLKRPFTFLEGRSSDILEEKLVKPLKVLVDLGASPNIQNGFGETPLSTLDDLRKDHIPKVVEKLAPLGFFPSKTEGPVFEAFISLPKERLAEAVLALLERDPMGGIALSHVLQCMDWQKLFPEIKKGNEAFSKLGLDIL